MCLAVEVKSGMLYYDGEPSLGRLSCKVYSYTCEPGCEPCVYTCTCICWSVESPCEASTRRETEAALAEASYINSCPLNIP